MTTNLLPIVTRKGLDTKLMKPISCLLRQTSLTCAWHTLRLAPVLLAPELIWFLGGGARDAPKFFFFVLNQMARKKLARCKRKQCSLVGRRLMQQQH